MANENATTSIKQAQQDERLAQNAANEKAQRVFEKVVEKHRREIAEALKK